MTKLIWIVVFINLIGVSDKLGYCQVNRSDESYLLMLDRNCTFNDISSTHLNQIATDGPKAKLGVYIVYIGDIDFPNNQYAVRFWAWLVHHKKERRPETHFEITNAKTYPHFSKTLRIEYEDVIWDQFYGTATIYQKWQSKYFPFDTQVLKLIIEPVEEVYEELKVVPDFEESRLAPNISISGWTIVDFKMKTDVTIYHTTSGDPKAIKGTVSKYSKIEFHITIKRKGGSTFSFLFIGMITATFLCILTLMSNIFDFEKDFTLGALFVAIGSQYIINSNLPQGAEFGLSHSIGIITFFGVGCSAITTLFVQKLSHYQPKTVTIYKLLNWILLILFISLQFGINGYFLYHAFL